MRHALACDRPRTQNQPASPGLMADMAGRRRRRREVMAVPDWLAHGVILEVAAVAVLYCLPVVVLELTW